MATNLAKTAQGAKTGVRETPEQATARKAAQSAWIKESLEGQIGVVIVPDFVWDIKKKTWLPADTFIRVSRNNPENGSLLLAAYGGGSNSPKWLKEKFDTQLEFITYCQKIGKVASLEAKYEAGQILEGRIDTEYDTQPSNPSDLRQDLWFINAAAVAAGIPCSDEDGNPYYQHRYLETDLSEPKPAMPVIDRKALLAEISQA